jgi:hypothetical protein
MEGKVRKKRTLEQRLHGINDASKRAGARHDPTMEQWRETLEYFDYKCAYCGGAYEVLEHYLQEAGTTASNCVPACFSCNVMKDKYGHDLSFYQNENVVRFIESKGVKIRFHMHTYKALKGFYWIVCCEECGRKSELLGDITFEEAQAYITEYMKNTGYAYRA